MRTKKGTLIFTLLILFTFSNCRKKEVVKQENQSTTTSQITKQAETTIEKINPKEYSLRMDSIKVQLVDIRTQEEFKQGHIENADNINVLDSSFVKEITKYQKSIPVYVYCTAGGKRSEDAAKILKENGYNVVNLEGGLIEWTKNGNKVVK
jgi:rhodanese-related sulfurtransferase